MNRLEQPLPLLRPQWPAPAHVGAVCSTRAGGISTAPFDSLNLGDHVGDDAQAVAANRRRLLEACPGLEAVSWLRQVHGTALVEADAGQSGEADAQFTDRPGLGCAVMTADCLPVLFCDRDGSRVASAHAGWRGLCAGVLERAAGAFERPDQVLAWLGPAISHKFFEVGAEVRAAFLERAAPQQLAATERAFTAGARPGHFMADLYQLARVRLRSVGVEAIYGGEFCTYAEPGLFYSYRRESITGRTAALIYLIPDLDLA